MDNENLKMYLDTAIENLEKAMPLLDSLNGIIPTDVLNRLDFINRLSVAY